ncbi:MAG: hypothetical protein M1825_003086 [Sarcosagium campestre]|nr:MAG: hypothetical protein M1825_003086 [Sarcosagium campestre]
MAPTLGSAFKSFWHTMISYDRHASYDSPYRTGQHVPLSSHRNAPLTSITTTGIESRVDLNSPYADDTPTRSRTTLQNGDSSPNSKNPSRPSYTPGMRSNSAATQGNSIREQDHDSPRTGEIQLQNFQEGLPPPPPVGHSWKRIDRWADENYTELYDQLSEGATTNDLNELEHLLDCSLPMEVRESIQVHDGQERGGRPTGIIFGCMLLDCEEIVQEWQQWRRVNQDFLVQSRERQPQTPLKAFAGSSSSPSSSRAPPPSSNGTIWQQELLARQDSQPLGAIQSVYAHPGWIPLARDWGGNNLAVDLAPGPAGKWGQVIIFGRDYDCKYVVSRSWSAFLAMVADDLSGGRWFVDEETQELKLREFKTATVEPGYLDILRWRADQKYGRKGPKRRPASGLANPSGASAHHGSGGSPLGSPVSAEHDRGRSNQRFNGNSASSSPRRHFPVSSPLAKVAEEGPTAVRVHTSPDSSRDRALQSPTLTRSKPTKLVEVATPMVAPADKSTEENVMDAPNVDGSAKNAEGINGLGVKGVNGIEAEVGKAGETLKTVEL